ncbi:hypothetical protein HELRODRAFT_188098 [Helobdella robusta]|uniref:Ig-like domain-containing protein n=1 Tax=Helobdella robusta TaxID=6412 RepID=T1FPM7_HELRO|nr:hypothetical protein HELRODRAFT_188098 [Helobdella robusta]ESO13075.1 hypothetical protein HELRODRAFT_188098 [Helobdella robusta]
MTITTIAKETSKKMKAPPTTTMMMATMMVMMAMMKRQRIMMTTILIVISIISSASTLDVRLPPSIVSQSLSHQYIYKRMNLNLTCIPVGYPSPRVQWIKDDKTIPESNYNNTNTTNNNNNNTDNNNHQPKQHRSSHHFSTLNNSTVLQISSATSDTAGTYRCMVWNNYGKLISPPMVLEMAYFDRTDDDPKSVVECIFGNHCKLRCISKKSNPAPIYKWQFLDNSDVVSNDRIVVNYDTIHVSNAIRSDADVIYVCYVMNAVFDQYSRKEYQFRIVECW